MTVLMLLTAVLRAVEVGGQIQTTQPIGMGPGWDYVVNVNGASAVYLGNGWMLTAKHVGSGGFTISGTSYSVVGGSQHTLLNPDDSIADLMMFQINGEPDLPALSLASTVNIGGTVLMIGYGDKGARNQKSWGTNLITLNNTLATDQDNNISTVIFGTEYGASQTWGITGDSGGAGFVYNISSSTWELAGIMIANDPAIKSTYFAQLNIYSAQINTIMGATIPEPSTWTLMAAGIGLLATARCLRRK